MSPEQLQRQSVQPYISLLLLVFIQNFPAWRRCWSSRESVYATRLGQYDGEPRPNGHLETGWTSGEGWRAGGLGQKVYGLRTVICVVWLRG